MHPAERPVLTPAPLRRVLIRHQYANEEGRVYFGLETDLPTQTLRWITAYLLLEFGRMPQMDGVADSLTPADVADLLRTCYGCRTFVQVEATGFSEELELWRIFHDGELYELNASPGLAGQLGITRPNLHCKMAELILSELRMALRRVLHEGDDSKAAVRPSQRRSAANITSQYALMLRVLQGDAVLPGEGVTDTEGRPYQDVLPGTEVHEDPRGDILPDAASTAASRWVDPDTLHREGEGETRRVSPSAAAAVRRALIRRGGGGRSAVPAALSTGSREQSMRSRVRPASAQRTLTPALRRPLESPSGRGGLPAGGRSASGRPRGRSREPARSRPRAAGR